MSVLRTFFPYPALSDRAIVQARRRRQVPMSTTVHPASDMVVAAGIGGPGISVAGLRKVCGEVVAAVAICAGSRW